MIIAISGKRRIDRQQLAETLTFINKLYMAANRPELIMQERYFKALDSMAPGNLPAVKTVSPDEDFTADVVVSIGGDGSLLRTARWVSEREIPIIGINSGHLGFLADVTLEDSDSVVNDIVHMNLKIEDRRMLMVSMDCDDPRACLPECRFALNEVAVLRDETASMITVETLLDGEPLAHYKADGLIIATPTGSTGYNLSVGGPIVAPASHCWVVSPIAAHSLTMRPLVVSSHSVINLKVDARVPMYRLSIDGQSVTLPLSARLTLSEAPFVTRIAHHHGHNFVNTLRSKLLWGIDAR